MINVTCGIKELTEQFDFSRCTLRQFFIFQNRRIYINFNRGTSVNGNAESQNLKQFRGAGIKHQLEFKFQVAFVDYLKFRKSELVTGSPKTVVFVFRVGTDKRKRFAVCVNPLFVFFVPHIKADFQRARNDSVYAYFCRIGEPSVSAADHKAEAKSDSEYRRNDYVSFCIFHYTFFSF